MVRSNRGRSLSYRTRSWQKSPGPWPWSRRRPPSCAAACESSGAQSRASRASPSELRLGFLEVSVPSALFRVLVPFLFGKFNCCFLVLGGSWPIEILRASPDSLFLPPSAVGQKTLSPEVGADAAIGRQSDLCCAAFPRETCARKQLAGGWFLFDCKTCLLEPRAQNRFG